MPTPLPLFLQLSGTFSAVFSRILFSQVSASHIFLPVFLQVPSLLFAAIWEMSSVPTLLLSSTSTNSVQFARYTCERWMDWLLLVKLKFLSEFHTPHKCQLVSLCSPQTELSSSLLFFSVQTPSQQTFHHPFSVCFSGAAAFPGTVSSLSLSKCCAKSVNDTLKHHFQPILIVKWVLTLLLLLFIFSSGLAESHHLLFISFQDASAKTISQR